VVGIWHATVYPLPSLHAVQYVGIHQTHPQTSISIIVMATKFYATNTMSRGPMFSEISVHGM